MKIAHEAPLSIFDQVQELTDYDYALVHLFEENEEYYNKFVEARDKGREIILDNSIFELGTAWDSDRFAYWVEKLKPDWYIVPDVLDNKNATLNSFNKFVQKYPDLPGKRIAVAQGTEYNELIECYEYLAYHTKVDKIALSFNHPFYQDLHLENKYFNMMFGRQMTLAKMIQDGIINKDKPHHLLGCGLPQEFKDYVDYEWIDSIDTSNPVLHGIEGIPYDTHGLNSKIPTKLYTLMDRAIDDEQLTIIKDNIKIFRGFCNV